MNVVMNLSYPFMGRWLVRNSPANRIPSHGTHLFGTAHAIDFVPVDQNGSTAPIRFGSLVRPEPPSRFPGFGREILAPAAGTIVDVHDGEIDHPAFRGLPSIHYALTQRSRAARGWPGLAGNYVLIAAQEVIVALCHLKLGSVSVRVGQTVQIGEVLGQRGNSGNSTEPHVHVQAMNWPDAHGGSPSLSRDRGRATPRLCTCDRLRVGACGATISLLTQQIRADPSPRVFHRAFRGLRDATSR